MNDDKEIIDFLTKLRNMLLNHKLDFSRIVDTFLVQVVK